MELVVSRKVLARCVDVVAYREIFGGVAVLSKGGGGERSKFQPPHPTHLFQAHLLNLGQDPPPHPRLHHISPPNALPPVQKTKMPPPVYPIAADELSTAAQLDAQGRRRKPEPGQKRVDLAACELLRMVQYRCEVQEPVTFESRVRCYPVERLFRR